MKLIAQLEELLYKAQTAPVNPDLHLKDWRILVHESQGISLGIKENRPGSVYTPPSYRRGESGEVFLVWQDGRCSQAKVQSLFSSASWEDELQSWRQAAYEDPEAREIPLPEPLPLVAVEDRAIQKILAGEDELLFAQMERMLSRKPEHAKLRGNIHAAWGYRHVRTSTGLAVTYQESQYALSFSFDSLVGAGFAKRRLIKEEEWEELWLRMLKYYSALGNEAEPVGPETLVVLSSGVVEDMLGHFILPNFWGQSVLEGQGAFAQERFLKREQVFGQGVSLQVDPLRPLELGTYLVTSEGVPAQRTTLVHKGALQTPILRVKDARRWGAHPTAIPQGTSGLYLSHEQEEAWQDRLSKTKDAVLILSVLGLHTQNSVSGEYSLSAPNSLRIKDGKITGKVDVKINGNFFRDLATEPTRFARSATQVQPYLVIKTGIERLG